METFLLFALEGQRLALRLEAVRRVVHMVELTPLPGASGLIRGVVNVQGEVVPVFDLRRLCGLPPAAPSPKHHLILAAAGEKTLALHVDAAEEIVNLSEEKTASLDGLISGKLPTEGFAPFSGDLVFIVDPRRLLAHAGSAVEGFS